MQEYKLRKKTCTGQQNLLNLLNKKKTILFSRALIGWELNRNQKHFNRSRALVYLERIAVPSCQDKIFFKNTIFWYFKVLLIAFKLLFKDSKNPGLSARYRLLNIGNRSAHPRKEILLLVALWGTATANEKFLKNTAFWYIKVLVFVFKTPFKFFKILGLSARYDLFTVWLCRSHVSSGKPVSTDEM